MGYLPYDVNLKTTYWIIVMIYLGIIATLLILKSIKTEVKSQKEMRRAFSLFFYLYIVTRIFFILTDYERDANNLTLLCSRYWALAYFFFILAFLNLIYLSEKYVIVRSRYIITSIYIILLGVNMVMVFFPNLMPIVRYINICLLISEVVLLLVIYIYLIINTSGDIRKKSILIVIGLIIMTIADLLEMDELVQSGIVLLFYSPILFAIGATIFAYAQMKS